MALTGITFVDTDLSTVLFDLHSADGSANSAWGSVITRFALGGHLKTTAPHDAERFERPGVDGAFTTFHRRGLGQAEWRQGVSASSEANLRLGLDRLTDLVIRGTILRLVTGTTTRYLRLEPSPYPVPYQGNEIEMWELYERLYLAHGLQITVACQPYWEGAEITTSGVTVPNDPATSTKVRVYPVTVSGSLPTPAKVRVQMDTGATVQRVLLAHRARNTRASTFFSDYLNSTGFFQCESTNRSWTITLGTNTSSVADANASGGNMARCTHTTDPLTYARRIRATRTANLDSLRGAWDVWIRVKPNGTRDYRLKMLWGPSTADPPAHTSPEVSLDATEGVTGVYVEKNLGRIYLPETGALGGLAIEVHTRQASGSLSNLDMDLIWLVPAPRQGTVVVPGGSEFTVLGEDLVTPVSSPAGGTGASFVGNYVQLDTTTDNVGTAPNGGMALPAGRHRVYFDLESGVFFNALIRVRNVSGGTDTTSKTVGVLGRDTHMLQFDAAGGGTLYQFQVDDPSGVIIKVHSIRWEFIPSVALNESIRTDPLRSAVDRLDSSANLAGYLGVEGELPLTLDPGDNHIMVRCDEVPSAGYNESENKLARTPTVTVAYQPRYSL